MYRNRNRNRNQNRNQNRNRNRNRRNISYSIDRGCLNTCKFFFLLTNNI